MSDILPLCGPCFRLAEGTFALSGSSVSTQWKHRFRSSETSAQQYGLFRHVVFLIHIVKVFHEGLTT